MAFLVMADGKGRWLVRVEDKRACGFLGLDERF